MQPAKIVALSVGTILAIGIGVALTQDDIAIETPAHATVAWRDDGTKVYLVPVVLKDGTYAEKEMFEAPCKRRPKGVDGKLCTHTFRSITGETLQEPAAELNRYPAETMTGDGCEPVACAVMLGDDAEAEEKPPVQR